VADNSKAAAMVECLKCQRRFQAIVAALTRKGCPYCGAELKAVEPKAKEPR
jgi:DNA-directed RNA polymerase subunit RPC12/RpoP